MATFDHITPFPADALATSLAIARTRARLLISAAANAVPISAGDAADDGLHILGEMFPDQIDDLRQPIPWPQTLEALARKAAAKLYDRMLYLFTDLAIAQIPAYRWRPDTRPLLQQIIRHLLPSSGDPSTAQWPQLTLASLEACADRISGPITTTWIDGVTTISYYKGLALDRPAADGPAHIILHAASQHEIHEYWRDGVLHRDPADGAARISRLEGHPHPLALAYYVDGQLHREHGPAELNFTLHTEPDGRQWAHLDNLSYYRYGLLHRDRAPAGIHFDARGRVCSRHWARHERLHRDDGPAVLWHDEAGVLICEQHFRDGELISSREQIDGQLVVTFPEPAGPHVP